MTGAGDVVVVLGGAVMTPTDLNEIAGCDDGALGAAIAPMPMVDVEPPARDCAPATIVDETRASEARTLAIR